MKDGEGEGGMGCIFLCDSVLACGSRAYPGGMTDHSRGSPSGDGAAPLVGTATHGLPPPPFGRIPEGCQKRKPTEKAAAPHPGEGVVGISGSTAYLSRWGSRLWHPSGRHGLEGSGTGGLRGASTIGTGTLWTAGRVVRFWHPSGVRFPGALGSVGGRR
jgi:hypothetical protein